MIRVFEDKPASREATPLLVGLVGPSSSGKTYSALRLATGIQRVAGGDIYVIDTEARRSLHYADAFRFRHLPFGAPFGSLEYLAAIEHCVSKGAKTIVIDSASHEHEGPGGVLEMHDSETQRLAALWKVSPEKAQMAGWQKPKSERRRLLNALLQMPINFVFCFRAKEKIDLRGPKPKPLGWMPIAGEEFVFEMTINCLLYPGSDGIPSWHSEEMGEKAIIKLPGWARGMFPEKAPLSEDTGEQLARWAAGGSVAARPVQKDGMIKPPTSLPAQAVSKWLEFWQKRGVEEVRVLSALGLKSRRDMMSGDEYTMNEWVAALKAGGSLDYVIPRIDRGDEPSPEEMPGFPQEE